MASRAESPRPCKQGGQLSVVFQGQIRTSQIGSSHWKSLPNQPRSMGLNADSQPGFLGWDGTWAYREYLAADGRRMLQMGHAEATPAGPQWYWRMAQPLHDRMVALSAFEGRVLVRQNHFNASARWRRQDDPVTQGPSGARLLWVDLTSGATEEALDIPAEEPFRLRFVTWISDGRFFLMSNQGSLWSMGGDSRSLTVRADDVFRDFGIPIERGTTTVAKQRINLDPEFRDYPFFDEDGSVLLPMDVFQKAKLDRDALDKLMEQVSPQRKAELEKAGVLPFKSESEELPFARFTVVRLDESRWRVEPVDESRYSHLTRPERLSGSGLPTLSRDGSLGGLAVGAGGKIRDAAEVYLKQEDTQPQREPRTGVKRSRPRS